VTEPNEFDEFRRRRERQERQADRGEDSGCPDSAGAPRDRGCRREDDLLLAPRQTLLQKDTTQEPVVALPAALLTPPTKRTISAFISLYRFHS
jgi:hypothetical protein